jgi:D-alanyl-D-alanine carboxypeptidase
MHRPSGWAGECWNLGGEGSIPGYESITMYSPSRRTTIVVASTKQANAITPTRMFQALAMDVYGPNLGFGLTPAQPSLPATPVSNRRVEGQLSWI